MKLINVLLVILFGINVFRLWGTFIGLDVGMHINHVPNITYALFNMLNVFNRLQTQTADGKHIIKYHFI